MELNLTEIIEVARAAAEEHRVSSGFVLIAMQIRLLEDLHDAIRQMPAGQIEQRQLERLTNQDEEIARLTDRLVNLQRREQATGEYLTAVTSGHAAQIRELRSAVQAHEGKIETCMDATQEMISAVGEHAKSLVEVREHVGIDG